MRYRRNQYDEQQKQKKEKGKRKNNKLQNRREKGGTDESSRNERVWKIFRKTKAREDISTLIEILSEISKRRERIRGKFLRVSNKYLRTLIIMHDQ